MRMHMCTCKRKCICTHIKLQTYMRACLQACAGLFTCMSTFKKMIAYACTSSSEHVHLHAINDANMPVRKKHTAGYHAANGHHADNGLAAKMTASTHVASSIMT